jgi:hypothetical protein
MSSIDPDIDQLPAEASEEFKKYSRGSKNSKRSPKGKGKYWPWHKPRTILTEQATSTIIPAKTTIPVQTTIVIPPANDSPFPLPEPTTDIPPSDPNSGGTNSEIIASPLTLVIGGAFIAILVAAFAFTRLKRAKNSSSFGGMFGSSKSLEEGNAKPG